MAVANGHVDTLKEHDVETRLAVLRGRYGHDGRMVELLDDARDAHAESVIRAEVAADRAFLNGLIDGSVELLSEDTFPRMEPLFAKYAEASEMFALLGKAAAVFGDAVQEIAAQALASSVIDEARRQSADE